MKKSFLFLAFIATSVFVCAQESIQLDTIVKKNYYISPEKVESYSNEVDSAYFGQVSTATILWPSNEDVLSPELAATFRQIIFGCLASQSTGEEEDFDHIVNATTLEQAIDSLFSYNLPAFIDDMKRTDSATLADNATSLDSYAFYNVSIEAPYNKNGIISFTCSSDNSGYSWFQPFPLEIGIVLDIINEKVLKLNNVIAPSNLKALQKELAKRVKKFQKSIKEDFQYSREKISDYPLQDIESDDLADWYINDEGLVFVFQRCEITPSTYAGCPEIVIPLKKLKPLLLPEALKYWGL